MGESSFASIWPGAAALLGILMIVTGLVLPAAADPAGSLTEQQAHEYYEAHASLEKAAAERGRDARNKRVPESPEEARGLEAARKRFEDAKAEVQTAKSSNAKLAFGLKVAGAALTILGAGGLLMNKS
ncbi:hypothetical protein [Bythopirellula goksoeyrii]|uniref:Uncharacterized protein n=1 Tax=Bythopirellula goksoeyrii TaxID=1400387 RepID=A0A5B9QRU7_9BACT|nr:hypothetical protein [Bythopirellula goksoeyrii]QEG36703.1 hypothetical protein Pr1d_40390 [Bythopirellula goksoeyrii]